MKILLMVMWNKVIWTETIHLFLRKASLVFLPISWTLLLLIMSIYLENAKRQPVFIAEIDDSRITILATQHPTVPNFS